MKTQLKPKTVPVKEVTKSSPSVDANSSKTKNSSVEPRSRSDLCGEPMGYSFEGVQVAKLKNR